MKRILIHTGLIAFLLTWPLVNIVLKNDAFRIIGGWSLFAFIIFVFIYAIIPVFVLSLIDYFLEKKSTNYHSLFRYCIFIIGAGIFWVQLTEYHLTPLIKGINPGVLNYNLYFLFFFSGLVFLFLIYKLRKYLFIFLKLISPLMLIALGALLFVTLQTEKFYSSNKEDFISIQEDEIQQKRVYILIFDGVSLPFLMEGQEINKELFPNFYRISKEWTWYRKAITNGTSTSTARPMMFSGRYYGGKLNSFKGFNDNLFQMVGSSLNTHIFFDIETLKTENAPVLQGVWLNKTLFVAYLNISTPPPLRGYLVKFIPRSWNFDWRGEVPERYYGKEQTYFGGKLKDQFSAFVKESVEASGEKEGFFLLWSTISHFPYIFDKNGRIIENTEYRTFEVGMDEETVQKVTKNYIETLQYVDFLLGRFIKKLEEEGLYKEAVILVTSDHGMSTTGSNYNIDERVFRIPFFLKTSLIEKGINDRDVQTVDITPTILDVLGISLSSKYQGQSLLRPYQERAKIIYALGVPGFWILGEDGLVWQK